MLAHNYNVHMESYYRVENTHDALNASCWGNGFYSYK